MYKIGHGQQAVMNQANWVYRMRRFLLLVGCICMLALSGCGGESSLPVATGKGSIRAINAIPTSPSIAFLIEERVLANVIYKQSSNTVRYDDLGYIFNFEVLFSGENQRDRVASQFLKVEADMEYTFLITGDLASPLITIWEKDLRSWGAGETVFSVQFSHTAATLGSIDVYFAAPGITPVLGEQRGTLSYTEVLPAIELEAGGYVVTVTSAGDPAAILFTSDTLTLNPQASVLLSVFDGDANDTSPVSMRAFVVSGDSSLIADVNYSPTIQFVQGSMALETSDIYNEETLTTPIVTDHAYTDVTGDITSPAGLTPLTYTAIDNVSAILFEEDVIIPAGVHTLYTIVGADTESLESVKYTPDRRPVETYAKFTFMNGASNHLLVDAYLVQGEASILDVIPRLVGVAFAGSPIFITLDVGTYDLYITTFGDKTILAGPITIDAALGDIIDVTALDTVDPSTAQVLFIPLP